MVQTRHAGHPSDEVLYVPRIGSAATMVDITRSRTTASRCTRRYPGWCSRPFPGHVPGEHPVPPLTKYTETTLTDPVVLCGHLAEIRQRGLAAMPGFGPENTAVAALRVVVPRTEENTVARVPVLMAAARGVSKALGWRGELKGALRLSH